MNKKLITLAVTSAMALPMSMPLLSTSAAADESTGPTVYGRVRLGIQRDKRESDSDNWGMENSSSRFGVKGTEVVNDDLKVLYQYEFGVTATEDNANTDAITRRLSWVGLEGEAGRLSMGRQISTYYALTGSNFDYGQGFNEENYLYLDVTALADKISDSTQYKYTFEGFTIGGDIVMDQDDSLGGENFNGANRDGKFDDVDAYGVGVQYKNEKFMVSGGYLNSDAYTIADDGSIDKADGEVWSLYTYYNVTDSQQVYFGFDDGSTDTRLLGNDTKDGQAYHVGYTGRFDNVGIWGVYSRIELDQKFGNEGVITKEDANRDHYSFGTAYYLTERTRFFAEGTFVDADLREDTNKQYIGIRHDF